MIKFNTQNVHKAPSSRTPIYGIKPRPGPGIR